MGTGGMDASIIRVRHKGEPHRLARYMAVGLISTAVDFTILVMLKSLGMPTLAANSLSYGAGFLTSFALNYLWTFSGSRTKHVSLHFAQFLAVGICGLLLNNALVLLFVPVIGQFIAVPSNAYIPAKILASCIVLSWNFNANRLWTFNDHGWKRT